MLDRIGAGGERGVDAVGAVGVDRDLLAVEMGGVDQRLDLVVENLAAEAGADAAVDAAGGGDLDDVDAAADLQRAPRGGSSRRRRTDSPGGMAGVEVLGEAEGRVHMAARWSRSSGRRRRCAAPTTSPRAAASRMARVAPLPSPRLRTVVKPASSVLRALARVRRVLRGASSVTSSISEAIAAGVAESRWTWLSIRPGRTKRSERSIRVAPAGRRDEAVGDVDDPAAGDHDRGRAARRLAGPVEQPAGVDVGDSGRAAAGPAGRTRRGGGEEKRGTGDQFPRKAARHPVSLRREIGTVAEFGSVQRVSFSTLAWSSASSALEALDLGLAAAVPAACRRRAAPPGRRRTGTAPCCGGRARRTGWR